MIFITTVFAILLFQQIARLIMEEDAEDRAIRIIFMAFLIYCILLVRHAHY